MNVSKELLSEVLGEDFEILSISKHFVKIRHLEAHTSVEWCIHKVAHACKEWAYEKYKYTIIEWAGGVDIIDAEEREIETFLNLDNPLVLFNVKFTLKACQWILDNRDKQ